MNKLHRFILSGTMFLATCAITSACPMCKDSIPNSDARQPAALPSGFNNSAYVMLGGLFGVIGLMTTIIVKGVRSTPVQRGFPITPKKP